jgi:hypothetical protein
MEISLEHLGASTAEGGGNSPTLCGTKSWSSRSGNERSPCKNWGPAGQPTACRHTDHNISNLFNA